MKKHLLSVVLILIVINLQAQFRLLKSINEVEILAGPSLVSLSGKFWEEGQVNKVGFSTGFGLDFKISRTFSFSPKILFELKGAGRVNETLYYDSLTSTYKAGKIESSTDFYFFSLPLLVRYKFGQKIRFYIEGGGYLSYLVKQQYKSHSLFNGKKVEINGIDDWERCDFGWSIKASMCKDISSNKSLALSVLNSSGLNQLQKEKTSDTFTRSTSLLISIIFKLKTQK